MKRKTFYRLSLLLPLAVLAATAGITIPTYALITESDNWFLYILWAFTLSAIIWGPLYTWTTVVLLLWGIGRSERDIQRAFVLSPLILAGSMGIPSAVLDASNAGALFVCSILHYFRLEYLMSIFFPYFQAENALFFAMAVLMMGGMCIIVGYLFVFPILWLDRALTKTNLLVTEAG